MSLRTHVVVWLTPVAAVLATPRPSAAAENADKCADAYELTQSEQRAGRLFEARKEARICSAACPPRLAGDCTRWETRITGQIPSFVVHARGAEGAPMAVEVQLDGAPATVTETGSIEAEPGPHRLSLRHAGRTVEAHVELVIGVRNQLVEVTIADSPAVAPAPVSPPASLSPRPPEPPEPHHPVPIWRWLFGGLGVGALATGGAISISGEVLAEQLRGSCKPHCTQAQADEVVQRWVIGGTVMGVGGAILLGAILWPGTSSSATSMGRGSATSISVKPGSVQLEVTF